MSKRRQIEKLYALGSYAEAVPLAEAAVDEAAAEHGRDHRRHQSHSHRHADGLLDTRVVEEARVPLGGESTPLPWDPASTERVDGEQDDRRVEEGEQLKLEKIEAATGDTIEFDQVLMVGAGSDVKIGAPLVEGGKVTAEVVSHGRHDKIRIVKFNRRKHYRKETGHRQWYTEVKITAITG